MPGRCLRQGDSLSPFLFIICDEGLPALVRKFESAGRLHGIRVVSHLFFADDSLFFFRSSMDECAAIRECFRLYKTASGQKINFRKSSILFSVNTCNGVRDEICSYMGVSCAMDHGSYLGLRKLFQQWEAVQSIPSSATVQQASPSTLTWSKPPIGSLKCNVDVATFQAKGLVGSGLILRYSDGFFVAAKSVHTTCSLSSVYLLAEAISICKALSWLKSILMH